MFKKRGEIVPSGNYLLCNYIQNGSEESRDVFFPAICGDKRFYREEWHEGFLSGIPINRLFPVSFSGAFLDRVSMGPRGLAYLLLEEVSVQDNGVFSDVVIVDPSVGERRGFRVLSSKIVGVEK